MTSKKQPGSALRTPRSPITGRSHAAANFSDGWMTSCAPVHVCSETAGFVLGREQRPCYVHSPPLGGLWVSLFGPRYGRAVARLWAATSSQGSAIDCAAGIADEGKGGLGRGARELQGGAAARCVLLCACFFFLLMSPAHCMCVCVYVVISKRKLGAM